MDNVGCSGSESVLVQCNHLAINILCGHAEDAGVRCTPLGTVIRMTIQRKISYVLVFCLLNL